MTAFYFSRGRVALNLLALPLTLLRVMFSAAGEALREVREDFIPAVRYVLTGTDVPGATRAAVKSGVSTAAVAVSSPIATFWRKHLAQRTLSLALLIFLPLIYLIGTAKTIWDEGIIQEIPEVVRDLVKTVFDGKGGRIF